MYEQFKTRAEAVSAEVHRFPAKVEAMDFIAQFLQSEGVADKPQQYAVWAKCPFLDSVDRAPLDRISGIKFVATRELAAALKAKVATLPSGHSLPAEAPDELLAALRGALN